VTFNIDYFKESLRYGVKYIPVTLKMALIVFILSALLGLLIATVRFYKIPVLSQILATFVTIYLGVPTMLALNVYYLLYSMFYIKIVNTLHLSLTMRDIDFTVVVYFTMILSTSCWMSETFRAAYKAIDKLQFEAGYSIGLTKFQTLKRIIFPQIVPVVLPGMMNWLTGTIKNMSLISAIGINEIMTGALKPCQRTYSFVEGYVASAIIYWIIIVIFEQFGKIIEKKSTKHRRQAI
jgi:L-cystine transport system permease protein